MNEEENLIPDLKNWKRQDGKTFSIDDWIISEGNVSFAIGYSYLFWPDFIEYEDCVIIKKHFDAGNFESWKQSGSVKDYSQIEKVLNHIHILDLFGTDKKKDEVNYEQIKFLGNKICEIFNTKLKVQFPDRDFVFIFNGNDILDAFNEYELTFYQEKNINKQVDY